MVSATDRLNPEVIAVSGGELRVVVDHLAALIVTGVDSASSTTCLALLHEAWGAATLCELHGLRLLFDESSAAIRAAEAGTLSWTVVNDALQDVFNTLPRLLNWMVAEAQDNPCLLIPEITALRALQRKPPVYEYQVLPTIGWAPFRVGEANLASPGRDQDLKQILHLYQLGLVNILRGDNRERGLDILMRCAGRLADFSASESERNYWTVYQLVLANFANGGGALRHDRLRLLAAVEKQLRSLAGAREEGRSNPYPEGLWRAFLALLAISAKVRAGAALAWLPLPDLGFVDGDLEHIRAEVLGRERPAEPGPFQDFERRAIRLRNALDAIQDGGPVAESVLSEMDDDSAQIARVARDIGLANIADRFQVHAGQFAGATGSAVLSSEQLCAYADAVLYLECALADFSAANPSREQLVAWGTRPLDEILQTGLARAARNSALLEMGAVLGTAKARIEVLQDGIIADDNWRDIEAGFSLIEGAAEVLELSELLGILRRAHEFVQTSRYHPEMGLNDSTRNLDFFADMVIGLEIYLDGARHGRDRQEDSLRLANDCVAALKF